MDRNKLSELKDAAEQKSLALNERRTELQSELDEITTELVRLQGDYRTIEQMIVDFDDEPRGNLGTLGDTLDPVKENPEKDEDGPSTTD